MVVSDRDRRDLYVALQRTLGERSAEMMMELLPPVGWGDLARQSDLVAVRGEMAEIRGEMAEMRGEMAEMRGELKMEISGLRGEIAELRGDLKAQLPRLYAANMATALATAGLVLAAARLA
jgi:hypothetical protein